MRDVNDMHEPDEIDQSVGSVDRRDFLIKAAAAGAVAWAAPVILSRPAWAQDSSAGSPACQPEIELDCTSEGCNHGQKEMAGVTIDIGNCVCGGTVAACAIITNVTSTPSYNLAVYQGPVDCRPNRPDTLIDQDDWECLDPSATTSWLIGRARGSDPGDPGAIPEMADGTVVTFTIGVWAGGCFDNGSTATYRCVTRDVSMTYDHVGNDRVVINCNTTTASVNFDFCTDSNPCATC